MSSAALGHCHRHLLEAWQSSRSGMEAGVTGSGAGSWWLSLEDGCPQSPPLAAVLSGRGGCGSGRPLSPGDRASDGLERAPKKLCSERVSPGKGGG